MINIPTEVLIANAFYTKQNNFLKYNELESYKKTLYRALNKKIKYISFDIHSLGSRTFENVININDYIFIKTTKGISCFNADSFDEDFINNINLIYDDDVRKLINETHNKQNKILTKKKNNTIL